MEDGEVLTGDGKDSAEDAQKKRKSSNSTTGKSPVAKRGRSAESEELTGERGTRDTESEVLTGEPSTQKTEAKNVTGEGSTQGLQSKKVTGTGSRKSSAAKNFTGEPPSLKKDASEITGESSTARKGKMNARDISDQKDYIFQSPSTDRVFSIRYAAAAESDIKRLEAWLAEKVGQWKETIDERVSINIGMQLQTLSQSYYKRRELEASY